VSAYEALGGERRARLAEVADATADELHRLLNNALARAYHAAVRAA
jgi:hypothetical protein